MIALARDAVRAAGLEARVTLRAGVRPRGAAPDHSYDAILSKDLLHHLPDPSVLWKEISRLGAPAPLSAVMDLIRPPTPADARRIVDSVARARGPDPSRGLLQLVVCGVHDRRASASS